MAKRKLEKERELFMSKSLPGFPADQDQNDNESDSDEDSDESDEKGILKLISRECNAISTMFHSHLQFVKRI